MALSGSQLHTDKLNAHPHRVSKHLLKIQSPNPCPALKEYGLEGARSHRVLAWWGGKTIRQTQKTVRSK